MKLSILENLPTISILDLCKQMANFSKKGVNSSSLPKLELLLYNGISITGRIINFQENSNKTYIWIENNIDIPEKINVLLLDMNQIIGISILDYETYQTCVELSKPKEIVGLLELRRKKKSIEELLEKLLSKLFPIEINIDTLLDEERSLIFNSLNMISGIFEEILNDEIGKSIFIDKVNSIEIKIANTDEVILSNGVLTVIFMKNNFQLHTKQREVFKSKMEEAF